MKKKKSQATLTYDNYRRPKTTGTLREAALDRAYDGDEEPTPRVRARRASLPSAWDDRVQGRENFAYLRAAKRMVLRGDAAVDIVASLEEKWGLTPAQAREELERAQALGERHHADVERKRRHRAAKPRPVVEVVHSGRKFHIYVDGSDSGKFAYSRSKAEKIAAALSGARKNPGGGPAVEVTGERDALMAVFGPGWNMSDDADFYKRMMREELGPRWFQRPAEVEAYAAWLAGIHGHDWFKRREWAQPPPRRHYLPSAAIQRLRAEARELEQTSYRGDSPWVWSAASRGDAARMHAQADAMEARERAAFEASEAERWRQHWATRSRTRGADLYGRS